MKRRFVYLSVPPLMGNKLRRAVTATTLAAAVVLTLLLVPGELVQTAKSERPDTSNTLENKKSLNTSNTLLDKRVKGLPMKDLLSSGGFRARQAVAGRSSNGSSSDAKTLAVPGESEEEGGKGRLAPDELGLPAPSLILPNQDSGGGGRGSNVFVNDPCLDPSTTLPFPFNFFNTVQSETEIAVLNSVSDDGSDNANNSDDSRSSGRLMVAGYNDSFGFGDNRQGLSGFSYSTNGGRTWIDGGGLPPRVPAGVPAGTPGVDAYFGDPVVAVHHQSETFYYASLYLSQDGYFTVSVNRGQFRVAPPQGVESRANTRCEGEPTSFGVPEPPIRLRERIIWEPPVEAVSPEFLNIGPEPGTEDDDFLDKPWLYVDQKTGVLYLTYTRFSPPDQTPIELVRSFDGGHTWTPPSVIVPNLLDTFNQATQAAVTPTGRVIVTYVAQTFDITDPSFPQTSERIEVSSSDDGGDTFGQPVVVADVNPQGEPLGYNRRRLTTLNAPYIAVDKGRDDGVDTPGEMARLGFGNVYITYYDGVTRLPQPIPSPEPPSQSPANPFTRAARIKLSRSTDNGETWRSEVVVNDDNTQTTHIFPSVQVNQHGIVFVTWIDRRLDPSNNILNDTWGAISRTRGLTFRRNERITNVSTDWYTRADIFPNFGDYNSSEVIGFEKFCSIWADARFPPGTFTFDPPGPISELTLRSATPDTLFAIFGESSGNDGN